MPRLKNFSTLSPVPGFRAWLATEAEREPLLLANEARTVRSVGDGFDGEDADRILLRLLEQPGWPQDPQVAAVLREPLTRLSARYLVHARSGSGRALDPVAHFHLSNGARVERLNWLGDISPKGLQQSAGMMVNYLYRLGDIETNHQAYRDEGRVVASTAVRGLTRAA